MTDAGESIAFGSGPRSTTADATRAAFADGGETLEATAHEAFALHEHATAVVAPLLDARQRAVVDHPRPLVTATIGDEERPA